MDDILTTSLVAKNHTYSHSLKDYKIMNIIGVMSETLSIAKPDADEEDDNFRIPTSLAC